MQRLDEIGYFEMGTRIMIMKRLGIHRPTIEDAVEISGIEMLHPGGLALTRRTAELAKLRPGKTVLDVSSGRGTQSMLYAAEYGVDVTGIDMLHAAGARSIEAEIDAWSQPEMFWKIRQDRDVGGPLGVLTPSERAVTVARLWRGFGIKGILKALVNESVFYRAVRGGRLGYGLFKGVKPERAA